MAATDIVIRGAREHNLRDVSLVLPRGKLICLTGVSGSGKSSLAFDTLYAEGQRRYVESLSSYARQFLGQMPKPEVDRIDGLSPSISIQQKTGGRNPRSTVGTITEINDYLRVLYARVGQGHCPNCGRPVAAQTREQIVARVLEELPAGTSFLVLAPVVRGQKGEYKDLFAELARAGYVRARVNGQVVNLSDDLSLDRQIKHQIEAVIDRLKAASQSQFHPARAVGRGGRAGPQARRRDRDHRRRGAARLAALLALCLRRLRDRLRPAQPAALQLQQPAGDVPGVRRPGHPPRLRPRSPGPQPGAVGLGRGDRALGAGQGDRSMAPASLRGTRGQSRGRPRRPSQGDDAQGPVAQPRREMAPRLALRHRRPDDRPPLEEPEQGLVARREMGRRRQRAPGQVSRRLRRPGPQPARAVHAQHDLPRVRGHQAQPRARAVKVGGKTLVELGAMPIGQVARFFDDAGRGRRQRRPRLRRARRSMSSHSIPSRGRSPRSCSRRSARGSHS